jgi:hypothetical protein
MMDWLTPMKLNWAEGRFSFAHLRPAPNLVGPHPGGDRAGAKMRSGAAVRPGRPTSIGD